MERIWLKKGVLLVSLGLLLCSTQVIALEFDTDLLELGDGLDSNIDINKFADKNYMYPGKYLLNVRVNQRNLGQSSLEFIERDQTQNPQICIPKSLVQDSFFLKPDILSQLTYWHHDQCVDIDSLAGARVDFDKANGQVIIGIPLSSLAKKYSEQIYDNGINGLFLNYTFSGAKSFNSGMREQLSLYGDIGTNIDFLRLRSSYQANSLLNQSSGSSLRLDNTYGYFVLPEQALRVQFGQIYGSGLYFDSVRFLGVGIRNESSLITKEQGYSPEVRGYADTNARVLISQQERILYETLVAAGPFVITDIPNTLPGTLNVKVEQDNGRVKTFEVNVASSSVLMRPGRATYSLAGGQIEQFISAAKKERYLFIGELAYGLSNLVSLKLGLQSTLKYHNILAGFTYDLMQFGHLSLQASHAQANLPKQVKQQGSSINVSYYKYFESIKGNLTFSNYRYSQSSYLNLNDFIQAHQNLSVIGQFYSYASEKERYALAYSQYIPFGQYGINSSLAYNYRTFWNSDSQQEVNFSFSIPLNLGKKLMIYSSFGLNRIYNLNNTEDVYYLSFNLPLRNSGYIDSSSSMQQGSISHSLRYSGRLNDKNDYSLQTALSQIASVKGSQNISGSWSNRNPYSNINASLYHDDYLTNFNAILSGGMTLTKYGIVLHPSSNSTRLLVDTLGYSDIGIMNHDSKSNMFGLAMLPQVNSYSEVSELVDLGSLPEDLEVSNPEFKVKLSEGAIGYVHVNVKHGFKIFANVQLENGTFPPFGSEVVSEDGTVLGIMDDDGIVYLSGVDPTVKSKILWADTQCELKMPNELTSFSEVQLPCINTALASN